MSVCEGEGERNRRERESWKQTPLRERGQKKAYMAENYLVGLLCKRDTATHCNTLQNTATHCDIQFFGRKPRYPMCGSTFIRSAAALLSDLQHHVYQICRT